MKGTVAVGIGHEVILVDSETKKSYKFGKLGHYPGQLRNISSLAISSAGNILVSDDVLNQVSMFAADGEFVLSFGTSPKNVRLYFLHIINMPYKHLFCLIAKMVLNLSYFHL